MVPHWINILLIHLIFILRVFKSCIQYNSYLNIWNLPFYIIFIYFHFCQSVESQLTVVKQRIIRYLGSLGGSTNHALMSRSDEEISRQAIAWDSHQHLKFDIPFVDMKPTIYLGEQFMIVSLQSMLFYKKADWSMKSWNRIATSAIILSARWCSGWDRGYHFTRLTALISKSGYESSAGHLAKLTVTVVHTTSFYEWPGFPSMIIWPSLIIWTWKVLKRGVQYRSKLILNIFVWIVSWND